MPNFGEAPLDPVPVAAHIARTLGTFQFELHPELWRHPAIMPFYQGRTWSQVEFISTPPMTLPAASGIYLFVVAPRCAALADHSYIFYVGQTGNLRSRYRQYLLERQGKGANRERVVRFLRHFDGFVHFHYTLVPEAQLDEAENLLKDNLTPFANDRVAKFQGRIKEAII